MIYNNLHDLLSVALALLQLGRVKKLTKPRQLQMYVYSGPGTHPPHTHVGKIKHEQDDKLSLAQKYDIVIKSYERGSPT